jgi:DNA ligase-1
MKPQLADNWLEDKQVLPAWQQPKYDGVRGLNLDGTFTGRSLKMFKNRALTEFFSRAEFMYLDGELILENTDGIEGRQCSLVTGLTGRIKGDATLDLIAFDYLAPDLIAAGADYRERYAVLRRQVEHLQGIYGPNKVRLMPYQEVFTLDEVEEIDAAYLDRGLEGSILRNHLARYKEGRPSTKVQELMRIKRFIDFEFVIKGMYEAMENQNEAKTNELGRTERSSHKENMVAKGMVGGFVGNLVADVVHNGKVLFPAGHSLKVGAGKSTHEERERWWKNPQEVVGQIAKAKTFPHQVKDKTRMPIFLSLRSAEDMS